MSLQLSRARFAYLPSMPLPIVHAFSTSNNIKNFTPRMQQYLPDADCTPN